MVSLQQKNQHLLWRAGFGLATNDVSNLQTTTPAASYAALVKASGSPPRYIDVARDILGNAGMTGGEAELTQGQQKMQEANKRREFMKLNREALRSLNLAWMNQMVGGEAQLREKMALFWHGHFACRDLNAVFQQMMLHQIRTHALGSFKDLLFAVSKSASMLSFLNNRQNRKMHPNENFAREVMELFTLGRGNYTENDVKEAARAFTGWGFYPSGEFHFRARQHDAGSKTVLGRTGNFTGDDVLHLLLEQKQTARHITRKVYRSFVHEQVDESRVDWLADRFYQSNYDIQSLLGDIFTSDWFYSAKHIGTHIKSPVELLVGMRRMIPMTLNNEEVQLLIQRALGQVLFYPPNVAGWPGGRDWIDSSSLMLRLRIPQLIKDNELVNVRPKADDDVAMGMREERAAAGPGRRQDNYAINASIDWDAYTKQFEKVPGERLYATLEKAVLQTMAPSVNQRLVEQVADKSSRENYIKTVTVALMSTPEYQMC